MNKTKKTLLIGAIVAALGAGAVGVGTTLAAEAGQRDPGFVSELVSAIAEKFDLDPSAVQEVFDEQAEARHEEMMARQDEAFAERLARAVEDGKLTQEQADAISAKHDEIRAEAESWVDMTQEDRQAAMREQREALRAWAEENDIPMQFLMLGPGPREGRGPNQGGPGQGMGMGGGMNMNGGEDAGETR